MNMQKLLERHRELDAQEWQAVMLRNMLQIMTAVELEDFLQERIAMTKQGTAECEAALERRKSVC